MTTLKDEIEKAYHKLIQIAAEIPHSMQLQKEIAGTGGKVSVIDLIIQLAPYPFLELPARRICSALIVGKVYGRLPFLTNLAASPFVNAPKIDRGQVELIAYQIGWGKLLLSWYEAGKDGKMPQMPGEGFSSWEYVKIAWHFYEKYHFDDLKEALEQFSLVVMQILQMVEGEDRKGNLEKTGVWSWCTLRSGKDWPLSKWVTVNTVSPYKKAAGLIQKFLVKANQFPPKRSNG